MTRGTNMGRRGMRLAAGLALLLGLGLCAPVAAGAAPAKAAISGLVTDAAGRPLSGVGILVATLDGVQVGEPGYPSTGEDGTYTVSGLAAGRYHVCFLPNDTYSRECRGDAPFDFTADSLLTIRGAQHLRGVDAVLDLKVSLSGRVISPSGAAVPDATVTVHSQGAEFTATSDADGRYVVEQVEKGSASLCVTPPAGTLTSRCWRDVAPDGDWTPIAVGSSNLTGYDVILPLGASVTGTVTDTNGAPVPGTLVTVTPQWPLRDTEPRYATTDQNGGYAVTGLLAGPYTVCFQPQALLVQPGCLGTEPGQTPATVELSLGQAGDGSLALLGGGAITGTVLSTSGQSLWGQAVYVSSEDWQIQRQSWLNRDGTYAAGGLPAGRYQVCGPNWVCVPDVVTVTVGAISSGTDITIP